MRSTYIVLGAILIVVIGGGFFLLNNKQAQKSSSISENVSVKNDTTSDASALSTRYVDYSSENFAKVTTSNGKAVLFFAALSWCPSCQAADRDFKAHFNKVPSDVTILKVDYDTAKDMKQKYAISMQDTFVQIDNQGKEVARWNSGGQGVEALLANVE